MNIGLTDHHPRRPPPQAGQGLVEYALILILVAIVVVIILLTMGTQLRNLFSNVVGGLAT